MKMAPAHLKTEVKSLLASWIKQWTVTFVVSLIMWLQHAPDWAISLLWGGYLLWLMSEGIED